METIFDHNVTEKEMKDFLGYVCTKEEYLSEYEDSEDDVLVDLAYLFHIRGNIKLAEKYINRVSDINSKHSFWRLVNHPTVPTFI